MNLLIRADASVGMGTGHVMRCLALAQAWQDAGGRAAFAMADRTEAIDGDIRAKGIRLMRIQKTAGSEEDSRELERLARDVRAEWVVLDGCQFGLSYQRSLRNLGFRILLIDDGETAKSVSADALLNQNYGAKASVYQGCEPSCRLLLGSDFILLRREFSRWVGWRRNIGEHASQVLVSMGGSDPDNTTLHALEALKLLQIEGLAITVLVGGSNARRFESAGRSWNTGVRFLHNISDVPSIMAEADIAIVVGGGTLWEALFMKCAVLSYARTPFQARIVRGLEDVGAAISLGNVHDLDHRTVAKKIREVVSSRDIRTKLSSEGERIVDGLGARRVVDYMLTQTVRV